MEQKVLAVVAGREITEADLDAFLKSVPAEQQMYLSNPQFRAQYQEQLIALHMFAQYGEDEKLNETEQYQIILENAKRDILANMAIARALQDVKVTEEDVKAYYEENSFQFTKGATVSAKHILVDSEEKCSEVLEMIINGEKSFEDAAKEFSTCPSKERGGSLGEFGKGQMVKEFEEATFAAEIDHVVGPVTTPFGYHLIKVDKKNEASVVPFEEVKDRLTTTLTQQRQNDAYAAKVAELKERYLQK